MLYSIKYAILDQFWAFIFGHLAMTYYGITSSPLNKPVENKEYIWVTTEQLLINKSILTEGKLLTPSLIAGSFKH